MVRVFPAVKRLAAPPAPKVVWSRARLCPTSCARVSGRAPRPVSELEAIATALLLIQPKPKSGPVGVAGLSLPTKNALIVVAFWLMGTPGGIVGLGAMPVETAGCCDRVLKSLLVSGVTPVSTFIVRKLPFT